MKITNCADALRRHHFEVETVRDTDEAFAVIKAAVETERPETVSFGDSMSMRATGAIEWLKENMIPYYPLGVKKEGE